MADESPEKIEVIHLSMADQKRFAKALLEPQPPTRALEGAFEAHRELIEPGG